MSEQTPTPASEATALNAASSLLDTMLGQAPAPEASPPQAAAPQQPAESTPNQPPGTAEEPQAAAPAEPTLSDLIRQQRQEKAARAARETREKDLQARLDAAEAKLAKVSKADLVADPIGFAQAHGLSEQEMALVGQAYLYSLVPDKAPPNLTAQLREARMKREAKQAEERREQEAKQMAAQSESQQIQQYTAVLASAIDTWDGVGDQHPYPASRAWFGGSHDEYTESLVHTARNIAELAMEHGEVADLSPKAVAAALERDIASRAARFRPPAAVPTQQSAKVEVPAAKPAETTGGKQPAVLSTKGQGGSPMPKALTEEERVRRAIEVLEGR